MLDASEVRSILSRIEAADLAQHSEAAPLADNVTLDEALQALVGEQANVNFTTLAGDNVKYLGDDFCLQLVQLRIQQGVLQEARAL